LKGGDPVLLSCPMSIPPVLGKLGSGWFGTPCSRMHCTLRYQRGLLSRRHRRLALRGEASRASVLIVEFHGSEERAMNANKALWEKGDFTRIAESMRDSGDALVEGLGITSGLKVLDLGCGDGTTALPAARRGAEVLGVDIAANLVAAGNQRASAEGLTNCTFQEGDASDLTELADDSFDLVVSIFGAMFAPKPLNVAREMVRVTRPGGRIVMGNWIPNDPTLVAQLLKISAAYSPPPPEGFISPVTWGIEQNVLERFACAGIPPEQISCARETYTFVFAAPPAELVAAFRSYYGPTMNAFDAAEAAGRADALRDELEALFTSQNTSANGTTIPATYLRVVVSV
jgi:SAM-dependent methyltransferase